MDSFLDTTGTLETSPFVRCRMSQDRSSSGKIVHQPEPQERFPHHNVDIELDPIVVLL